MSPHTRYAVVMRLAAGPVAFAAFAALLVGDGFGLLCAGIARRIDKAALKTRAERMAMGF